ncbi:hypothetical protein XELAEV_18035036mg [Xenopus laevis]|uniref:Uncharacterized protein n=1 Tax=Xenopus laevis TaxID=8355 RepID=A0A974CF78_XENLA|nr:hypothetical protein XELAEV_18035036mg [Xenopus laevis]
MGICLAATRPIDEVPTLWALAEGEKITIFLIMSANGCSLAGDNINVHPGFSIQKLEESAVTRARSKCPQIKLKALQIGRYSMAGSHPGSSVLSLSVWDQCAALLKCESLQCVCKMAA